MNKSISENPVIHASQLSFSYLLGTPVLHIPEFTIQKGETLFLYGPSGSGKTTFLGLLSGILNPTAGSLKVFGQEFANLPGKKKDLLRASNMGYIFQMFNLIPYLSVMENIILPCRLNAQRRAKVRAPSLEEGAKKLAIHLNIEELLFKKVTELSVGQQQRVAAARALLGAPRLVIADEPTSALDTDRREQFLKLLFAECEEAESALIFVSHDRTLMPLFSRSMSLLELNSTQGVK